MSEAAYTIHQHMQSDSDTARMGVAAAEQTPYVPASGLSPVPPPPAAPPGRPE